MAIDWNGNWVDSSIVLPEDKYSTIKVQQVMVCGQYFLKQLARPKNPKLDS